MRDAGSDKPGYGKRFFPRRGIRAIKRIQLEVIPYLLSTSRVLNYGEVILNCIGLEWGLLEQINKFRFFGNDLVLSKADVIFLGASQIPIGTYSQHADEGKNAHQDAEKILQEFHA